MTKLIFQAAGGTLSFWLADRFVPGVNFVGGIQYLFFTGALLGAVNFFIKPVLKAITLPLRILTLGLLGIVINMAIIWFIDIAFPELIIQGVVALFLTTIIAWLVSFFLGLH
ncbi:MAG: phage holin family protein [bacterium]|nr:phage holin family protein [bacterium]